jgi:hypothetical protein
MHGKISLVTRALIVSVVAVLALVGTAMGEVTRTGLVAEWHFDGDAKDSSGNGNDGTIYGAIFVDGISGKALSFRGTDDYVSVGSIGALSALTVEGWAYYETATIDLSVFGSTASGEGNHISLRSNHIELQPNGLNWENRCWIDTGVQTANEWHYLALTWDGTTAKGYLDNTLIGSCNVTGTLDPSATNAIGRHGSRPDWYMNGLIDEVRIYNRALSASEIKANYEVYKGGSKELNLKLINSVSSRIDTLKRNNLDTSIIEQALKNAKDAYDFGKYDEAYPLAQNAQKMADDAYQSYQDIKSAQSEIDREKFINADVSKAENKLKEAKDALAKGDYQRAQSWANEAMQLAKHASIGTVSIKNLKALVTKYDERSVVLSGTIRNIETVNGKGYEFAMDDGSGMISVVYQGSLGDIKDGDKVTTNGIFQASNGTVVADNVQKSGITSAPAFEVILAGIGILMAFVLRRR